MKKDIYALVAPGTVLVEGHYLKEVGLPSNNLFIFENFFSRVPLLVDMK